MNLQQLEPTRTTESPSASFRKNGYTNFIVKAAQLLTSVRTMADRERL